MKKLSVITGTVVIAGLLTQAQMAFAQNVAGVPQSREPVPTTTTTGGGANTTGTTVGGTGTQPGTTTGTRTQTGTTTGTRTPAGTNATTTTNLPTPADIPVVPTLTQETVPAGSQTSTLVCDQDKCAATVQKAMGNEVIVMTILFLGSAVGGILWILALMMMKKGVVERESRRMGRQNRMHLQSMLTAQKTKMYNSYIDAVMSLLDKIQHKKPVGNEDMKSFRENSVFITMHGSKHLRAMNEHIASLINTGKPLATPDRIHLKSELSKTIRADLI